MFRNYLTVALRHLLRYKGYSVSNVMGLAIGMACCVLILLYVQDELSYDQHHENKDRIYRMVISSTVAGVTHDWATTPPPWAPVLAEEYPEIEQITRIKPPNSRWLVRHGEARFYERNFVFADPSIFDVFSIPLVQGNPKTALAEPHAVVVSEAMIKKFFGNENPIGQVISADDQFEFTVTGIMRDLPKTSHFQADFLASFATMAVTGIYNEPTTMENTNLSLYTYLLLKDGSVPEDLELKFPGFLEKHLGERLRTLGIEIKPYLQPLTDIHLYSNIKAEIRANSDIRYVYIFSSLAGFVLLIACVNFMNLSTARSARRAQEVGIRKVLGAQRNQLIKQFTGESVVFAMIALCVALGLVHLLLPQFNLVSGKDLDMDYRSSWLVPSLAAIALFAGIAAGGYPAFILSSFRPVAVLSGALKAGASQSLLRKALITLQFTVSIIMIVGTAVISDQMEYMQNKKLGFDKEHLVVVRLPDKDAILGYQAYKNGVLQYPEVINVSASTSVPGSETSLSLIQPEGFLKDESPYVRSIWVGFDFIETMDIEITSGRTFSREFTSDEYAALINETAARTFGWEDPIGKTFRYPGASESYPSIQIIGVLADFHIQSLHQPIEPLMVMFWEEGGYMVVRLQGQSLSRGLEIMQDQWRETYPNHPAMEYTFLDQDLEQLYLAENRLGSVFITGAVLSILIACLGLLGLASFMAEQRTREIGVRKVLGASITNVILLLSKDFTKLILLAFVVGAAVSYYAMQSWLGNFNYRIELSYWTFVFAGVAALLIAWMTVGYHAYRAAVANPAESLHGE